MTLCKVHTPPVTTTTTRGQWLVERETGILCPSLLPFLPFSLISTILYSINQGCTDRGSQQSRLLQSRLLQLSEQGHTTNFEF